MVSAEMQIGKNGVNENFMGTLKSCFQNHDAVRITVLKSAHEEKDQIKKYSEEILKSLGENYTCKLIGFKIIVKKWRRARSKVNSK